MKLIDLQGEKHRAPKCLDGQSQHLDGPFQYLLCQCQLDTLDHVCYFWLAYQTYKANNPAASTLATNTPR
jgi:hypothetical protein